MRFLSIAGTAAMFLVGGGILVHGVPALHHLAEAAKAFPPGWLWENLFNAAAGIAAGAVIVGAVLLVRRLRGKPLTTAH
jgi:predicted DNA repair protein MutK